MKGVIMKITLFETTGVVPVGKNIGFADLFSSSLSVHIMRILINTQTSEEFECGFVIKATKVSDSQETELVNEKKSITFTPDKGGQLKAMLNDFFSEVNNALQDVIARKEYNFDSSSIHFACSI